MQAVGLITLNKQHYVVFLAGPSRYKAMEKVRMIP